MLSCCQRGERRTLANNQRDRYKHVSWLHNKPYISPTPCMNNIQSNSVKCHDLTPKRKKGKAQMEALKRNTPSKGRWRVSPHWMYSFMPAEWQTFFLRVLHEMYPKPHYAYSGVIVLHCVRESVHVRAHVQLITEIRPVSLWQIYSIHAWYQRAGPEPSGWMNRPIAAGRQNKAEVLLRIVLRKTERIQNALLQQGCQNELACTLDTQFK